MNLREETEKVLKSGPERVLINKQGNATTPQMAKARYGIIPHVIFLRDDGWTIGAPRHLENQAFALWASHWVAVMRNIPGTFEPL